MEQNDQAENRLFVVGLCGSIRRGSYTRMAVQLALHGAQEVGAQTRLIDLKDYHLLFWSCSSFVDFRKAPCHSHRRRARANKSRALAEEGRWQKKRFGVCIVTVRQW